jgi:hypothetical protein
MEIFTVHDGANAEAVCILYSKTMLVFFHTHGGGNRRRLSTPSGRRNEVTFRWSAGYRPDYGSTPRYEKVTDLNWLSIAEAVPLLNEQAHGGSHDHDLSCDFRAFLIPVYLVVHDGLRLQHAHP